MAPTCPIPNKSRVDSSFSWSFNWSHVVFGPNANNSIGTPTGQMTGSAHQQYNVGDGDGVMPCERHPCDQTVSFNAGVGDQGDPMTLLNIIKRSTAAKGYSLNLAYENTPSTSPACHDMDPSGYPWYVQYSSEGQSQSNTEFGIYGAASVTLAQLESRKTIVLDLDSTGRDPIDCGDASLGLTCSRFQAWAGEVTLKPLN